MCLEIYELDPAKFPVLAWQTALKNTELKFDLLTDINILLIVEKGQRGICHSIYQYAKGNSKYVKNYDKNKETSYIECWDINNLYGWEMP